MFELLASRSGRVHVCGHRGHSIGAPENTIAAFQRTKELGGSSFEIDVVLSQDREIVVLHDETLDRTTSGTGFAADMPALRITQLDAGSSFSAEHAGERVPLLRDTLVFAKEQEMGLHIEIKDRRNEDALIDRLGVLVEETQTRDWAVVISFDHQQLLKAKARIPGIRTEGITHARHADPTSLVRAAKLDSVSVELDRFYPEDAAAIHAAGVAIRLHLPVPSKLEKLQRYGRDVRQEVGEMLSAGCMDSISGDDVAYLRALVDDFPLAKAA